MRAAGACLLACLALASSARAEDIVRAADYDAFWLWAGVRSRPELKTAATVYLLQGEIGSDEPEGKSRLKAQGGGGPAPHTPALWLVYRVRSLNWGPEIFETIARRLSAWRSQPGVTVGVQLDFDASTHGLSGYAQFLRAFRAQLPPDCALSVTGLMDWASQGAPEDLNDLASAVDEVVFQTYRGRETVAGIDAYVNRLDRVHMPFRLGLAEGAVWSPSPAIARNPNFKGYVIFLRNLP